MTTPSSKLVFPPVQAFPFLFQDGRYQIPDAPPSTSWSPKVQKSQTPPEIPKFLLEQFSHGVESGPTTAGHRKDVQLFQHLPGGPGNSKKSTESQGPGMENGGILLAENSEESPVSPTLTQGVSPDDHMDIMRGVRFQGKGGGNLVILSPLPDRTGLVQNPPTSDVPGNSLDLQELAGISPSPGLSTPGGGYL